MRSRLMQKTVPHHPQESFAVTIFTSLWSDKDYSPSAPKKAKKLALTEFLADESLGSWADEMDSLPTAPTIKTDEDRARDREGRRGGDYGGRERDFPPRYYPPREELPLPTKPPYVAFVGNLAFDIHEEIIAEYFSPNVIKDIKIIRDREDHHPKGFGYVEFDTLDGLKDALSRTGGQLAGRSVRVSVAEPPKERTHLEDERLAGPWRREGPLPPLPPPYTERAGFGGNFAGRTGQDGDGTGPPLALTNDDWRSNRTSRPPPPPERERSGPPRRTSVPPELTSHPAHAEFTWTKGSKFHPSVDVSPPPERRSMFGGRRGDGLGSGSNPDEVDWRAAPRRTLSQSGSTRGSPNPSNPTTPQLGGRRKLELLPRGSSTPPAESPMTSPKSSTVPSAKSNPFGNAKPVDASAKEKEVAERLEQEKDRIARAAREKEKERSGSGFGTSYTRPTSMTRTESHKSSSALQAAPASPSATSPSLPASQSAPHKFAKDAGAVRPKFSFAAAAAGAKGPVEATDGTHTAAKTESSNGDAESLANGEVLNEITGDDTVEEASRKLGEVTI
ncbi:uncharacterized protein EI90DRAFT_3117287 [Cantharellus anzutake]|uniref:uncharacterized protein n=1 Tax=Cantharellus anzutake TaxID=1750568 RepID=UPI0019050400|nr:uncharacterized protein EI90DRAFT_3117287 [Cantharellus anzutake]KAF8340748.1 hypothetical protein EI90DRAFT_3117287 [Cantharellus anzutake]